MAAYSRCRARGRRFVLTLMPLLVAAATPGVARAAPSSTAIVTGQDAGWPDVIGWDRFGVQAEGNAPWGSFPIRFSPYPTYQQGVRVAVGDVTGDGRPDIVTAPGKSAFTEVRVFDGKTFRQLGSFMPFRDAAWWNGAFVATGDTNGDGRAEIITGLDAGCCTTLHVLDGLSGTELSGFFPYGDRDQQGVRVAAADLNGDGKAELVAVPIGGDRVSAFAPTGGEAFRTIPSPFASGATGLTIAAGNVMGDARPELVAAADTRSGAQLAIVDVRTGATLESLSPFGAGTSAPQIAVADVDGDGRGDVVAEAQSVAGTQVKAFDAVTGRQLASFFVLEPGIVPGVTLAAGDLDGDGKAEIVLGGGPTTTAPWPPVASGPDQRVVVYRADGTVVGGFSAYPGLFQGGVRVALGDLDLDGAPEVVTAPGPGMEPEVDCFSENWLNGRDRGTRLAHFLAFEPGFRGGVRVAVGDVLGRGEPQIVAAPGPGRAPEVRVFDLHGTLLASTLAFERDYQGGLTVAAGDLNGDGRAEIIAGTLAGPARVHALSADGTQFGPVVVPFAGDIRGVEVGVADLAGTGRGVILAGQASGADPRLAVIEPASGSVVRVLDPAPFVTGGIRVAGGDIDGDGRDEIVVTPGFGGDGLVRVLNRRFVDAETFKAYPWDGAGMNVAVRARIGLPIRAEGIALKLVAGRRARSIVAHFHDAAAPSNAAVEATIDWGDGTEWQGLVLKRGAGMYDVRSTKRYARRGRYVIVVTLADDHGRSSTARSTAVVRRKA
jgi:FG-GAP-like repeat